MKGVDNEADLVTPTQWTFVINQCLKKVLEKMMQDRVWRLLKE